MRRSGIKRKSPIRAARGTAAKGMLNRGPTKKRRDSGTRPKVSKRPLKDLDHRDRVKELPCLLCGGFLHGNLNDAHHIRECFPRTMGRRKGDDILIPLCRSAHNLLHKHSRTFWEKYARMDPVPIAAALYAETLSLRSKANTKSSVAALQPRREG